MTDPCRDWKPRFRRHANGRISFPGVVRYRIVEGPAAGDVLPYPPTAETHPGKPDPIVYSGPEIAKLVATGKLRSLPRSVAYRIEVLDPNEHDRLFRAGWIHDSRHTGADPATWPIDTRTAPGA